MRSRERWPHGFGRLFFLLSVVTAAAVTIGLAVPAHAQVPEGEERARQDQAIETARAGNHDDALAELETLLAIYPDNLPLIHDYVTVLAWAERDLDVSDIAAELTPENAPREAQHAVAKSARNLQRYELAALWYDAARASDPTDSDALSGSLMTAADAGDFATVRNLIAEIEARTEADAGLALARAYGLRSAGDLLPALSAYETVLAMEPENFEALRGKALVLRAMLLPTHALALADEHPGILSDAETERLRADESAIRLRLTARTPYPEPAPERQKSIERIDAQLDTASTDSTRNALLLDRVVALSDANEAEAAIETFESLPPTANLDQVYVLAAAADAYMQAQRPAEALDLLERALELEPDNVETLFALVYAHLDLEHYDEAYALTRDLTSNLPMIKTSTDGRIIKANEVWMRAELLAGIAEAYGDQLETAQARFEELLAEAPNNSELRQELANVYRWRGWLDRSLNQYRQVLTNNDDLLGAALGHAHAQIDAREYAAVEETIESVTSVHSHEPAVQRLAERWQVHNERELIVSASTGESSGPIAGTEHYTIDARWYTAPIAYRYRAFVATHDGFAEFPEGDARRRRIGAGVEYRAPRFTASGSVSTARSGDRDVGAAAAVDYRLNDFWSIDAGLEWQSDSVQLRAQRLGIEADRLFAGASFAPTELVSARLGINRLDYSDGNAMQSISASGRYRFFNRPRSKIEATGSVAFGAADSSAVSYYSPTRDRSLTAGLSHLYRLFRRYERELAQVVSLETGRTAQSGFDSGSTWRIAYRIDWRLSDRLATGFGVDRLGQYFDGAREHSTIASVSMSARF